MTRASLIAILLCIAAPAGAAAQPASPAMATAPAIDPARARQLYLAVIRKLHQDGKSHAALAYLDDFDRRYPADAAARLLRADCLVGTGQLAEAQTLYQSLAAGPERAAALSGLGQVAGLRGDWAAAVTVYAQASGLEPVNAVYRNDLGYALFRAGAVERALFTLRQASELDPANPVIAGNLALAAKATHP